MTTDRFTTEQFEKVLHDFIVAHPKTYSCVTSKGLVAHEYRYAVPVNDTGHGQVIVEIASSINYSGFADGTGENSIRLWLTGEDGLPLGSKISRWVTRVSGWEGRITQQLEKLSAMGEEIQWCTKCSSIEKIFIVKKDGKNKGRLFIKCQCQNSFSWLDEFEQTPEDKKADTKNAMTELNRKPVQTTPTGMKYSPFQQAIFDWVKDKKGKNLVVEALAGSGKTTTGVEILKLIPDYQDAVYVAFNKHIAVELAKRVGDRQNVRVSTYHSLGYAACRQAFGNIMLDESKVDKLMESVLDKYLYRPIFPAIRKIVSLVKANLSGLTFEELDILCNHYGIELNGDRDTIFTTVNLVVAKSATMTNVVDFDDMCWFPVYHNLTCKKYDFLFIDEAQDTNKVQIALALKSVRPTGRIVAVGDRYQSLYGFRGADVDAIPNLIENLKAETLPLSITYRNPKSVVALVNDKFPTIPLQAAEWAEDGSIRTISEMKADGEFMHGDMVLCRTNAPLVAPAFALIRRGIKAVIRGRDIGSGLTALIRKMKAHDLSELLDKVIEYKNREVPKLLQQDKGGQAQSLEDKCETLCALADGIATISELETRIELIFSDDNEGVVFSSVHRAKGLEARRVYILHPELMPHPMAKQDWERQQEQNIIYVAYTRTLYELVFVEG